MRLTQDIINQFYESYKSDQEMQSVTGYVLHVKATNGPISNLGHDHLIPGLADRPMSSKKLRWKKDGKNCAEILKCHY